MILYMLKMKKREFEKYMNRFVYGITPILCIYKITVVFEMQKKLIVHLSFVFGTKE